MGMQRQSLCPLHQGGLTELQGEQSFQSACLTVLKKRGC